MKPLLSHCALMATMIVSIGLTSLAIGKPSDSSSSDEEDSTKAEIRDAGLHRYLCRIINRSLDPLAREPSKTSALYSFATSPEDAYKLTLVKIDAQRTQEGTLIGQPNRNSKTLRRIVSIDCEISRRD